jgi:tetratricopeptide (TPR) repeat protein
VLALHSVALVLVLAQAQSPAMHPSERIGVLGREVVADLLVNDIDVLLERRPSAPASINETIKWLHLCLRAGRRTEAATLIDRLGELNIDLDMTRALLELLMARREVDLAARLIERIPGSGRDFQSNVVNHWLNVDRKPQQEVDKWVAARGWNDDRPRASAAAGAERGPGVPASDGHGGAGPPPPRSGFGEVSPERTKADGAKPPGLDLDIEPHTATEARDRGLKASWDMPAQAAVWFERALAMPFTPGDIAAEKRPAAIEPDFTDAEWERRFRAETSLRLAEQYKHAGEPAKAQAVLRRAAAEDPSIVSDVGFADLAGGAQIASGARQIEQEIRGRERENEKSIEYWLARASYFIAREEQADVREAFERALSVARTEPLHRNATQRVLRAYSEHLDAIGAHAEARQVFKRVLADSSIRGDEWILDELAEHIDDDEQLAADAEWIWKELERRADWEPAIKLLDELVGAEERDKRATVVNRALSLVSDRDRGRVLPLARALAGAGEPGAAVPLFEHALADAPASDLEALSKEVMLAKRAALQKQFQAEIDQDDWRRAKQTWTALLQGSSEVASAASAYAKLARAAAQKGDGAEALRFWRAAANLDRTDNLWMLDSFPLSRYRAELTRFYEQLATRDPASWVPAAALERLRR